MEKLFVVVVSEYQQLWTHDGVTVLAHVAAGAEMRDGDYDDLEKNVGVVVVDDY